jgi:hypothetical protein
MMTVNCIGMGKIQTEIGSNIVADLTIGEKERTADAKVCDQYGNGCTADPWNEPN